MSYSLQYDESHHLKKELNALKKSGLFEAFLKQVETVLKHRPFSGKPLSGKLSELYRIKLRNSHRIVYKIDKETHTVIIKSVLPRSQIYKHQDELGER